MQELKHEDPEKLHPTEEESREVMQANGDDFGMFQDHERTEDDNEDVFMEDDEENDPQDKVDEETDYKD